MNTCIKHLDSNTYVLQLKWKSYDGQKSTEGFNF